MMSGENLPIMALEEKVLVIKEVEGEEVDDGKKGDGHRAEDDHLQGTTILKCFYHLHGII
jgi:hypothetical protein